MSTILPIENQNINELNSIVEDNYQIMGFIEAGKYGGSIKAFAIWLQSLYSTYVNNSHLKSHTIDTKNEEIANKKESIKEKITALEKNIDSLTKVSIPEGENELKKAEEELTNFKMTPEKYINKDEDKMSLYFYGALSITLAIFLFVFYSSVIYSALFRDITITKNTIFMSIFYPRAFEEALSKGIASFTLILFSPFIFISLGIIIENYKSKLNSLRAKIFYPLFLIFVFTIDSLLAFHISERIHESKAINSFGNVSPYYITDAITDANYWIIIALGFVVYFIFGKIFAHFNELRLNKNKFDEYYNMLLQKVNDCKVKLDNYKNEVKSNRDEINKLSLQEAEIINYSDKVFVNVHEVNKILTKFSLGWMSYLTHSGKPEKSISDLEEELNSFNEKIEQKLDLFKEKRNY